jgi:hypothetical protein
MSAFAAACLVAGSAVAQETPLTGASSDQDQANNERYWGIVNNSNNAFKTWPVSLSDPAFDKWAAARQARRTASAAKTPAPPAPVAEAKPVAPVAPVTPATAPVAPQ